MLLVNKKCTLNINTYHTLKKLTLVAPSNWWLDGVSSSFVCKRQHSWMSYKSLFLIFIFLFLRRPNRGQNWTVWTRLKALCKNIPFYGRENPAKFHVFIVGNKFRVLTLCNSTFFCFFLLRGFTLSGFFFMYFFYNVAWSIFVFIFSKVF